MQHYSFLTPEIEQINRHAPPLLGISQLPPMSETVDGKDNLISDAGVCVQEALTNQDEENKDYLLRSTCRFPDD